jgi:hypothetical protein
MGRGEKTGPIVSGTGEFGVFVQVPQGIGRKPRSKALGYKIDIFDDVGKGVSIKFPTE